MYEFPKIIFHYIEMEMGSTENVVAPPSKNKAYFKAFSLYVRRF